MKGHSYIMLRNRKTDLNRNTVVNTRTYMNSPSPTQFYVCVIVVIVVGVVSWIKSSNLRIAHRTGLVVPPKIHTVTLHHQALNLWKQHTNNAPTTLIHIDSHSDLALPHASVDGSFMNEGNFITYALTQMNITRMIWIRPALNTTQWQPPTKRGRHLIRFGVSLDGEFCCDDEEWQRSCTNVTLSNEMYPLSIDVVQLEDTIVLESMDDRSSIVLDIDLDFFSVLDPNMQAATSHGITTDTMYRWDRLLDKCLGDTCCKPASDEQEEVYLKYVNHLLKAKSWDEVNRVYNKWLKNLHFISKRNWHKYSDRRNDLSLYSMPVCETALPLFFRAAQEWRKHVDNGEAKAVRRFLKQQMKGGLDEPYFALGPTSVSTPVQIDRQLLRIHNMLSPFLSRIRAVTIAKSPDYTPQVGDVEKQVSHYLHEKLFVTPS